MSIKRLTYHTKLSARLSCKPSIEQLERRTVLSDLIATNGLVYGPYAVSFGQTATFTTDINTNDYSLGGNPTSGDVQVIVNGLVVQTFPVTNEVFTLSEPVGRYTVQVHYLGDGVKFAPSSDDPGQSFEVDGFPTTIVLTPEVATVDPGEPGTFVATVSSSMGTPPGGSVEFNVNDNCCTDFTTAVALSGGSAQLILSEPVSNPYIIFATYLGDPSEGYRDPAYPHSGSVLNIMRPAVPKDIAMLSVSSDSQSTPYRSRLRRRETPDCTQSASTARQTAGLMTRRT